MRTSRKVLVTGGAGYIGSLLTGVLLNEGWQVTVLDSLVKGGDCLLPYFVNRNFRFVRGDICDANLVAECLSQVTHVVHLAAIVGFPACDLAGEQEAWRCNVEGTRNVFVLCNTHRVERFIFASTYSNYGLAEDGEEVCEESPLHPQSLYAQVKIAAERYLLEQQESHCMPLVFRFATLFGISPHTRFDLIINQFVLEALANKELVIYDRDYSRSFVHVRDVVDAICLGLTAPEGDVRGQVYNVGSEEGNLTKTQLVNLIQRHISECHVSYQDRHFGGDLRDIRVSFAKIRERLGFRPKVSIEQGILEVRDAIRSGLITDPLSPHHRNAVALTH